MTLIPTAVQGAAAEQNLLDALELAPSLNPDVVLITRGGGSLEDLWSFNLESVARALAACPYPTVSAVGHEIDVTICDFVADMRAPTPSAAAEMIVPDAADLNRTFGRYSGQLRHCWRSYYEYQTLRLDNVKLQLQSPERILERANQRVDDAAARLTRELRATLTHARLRLAAQARHLQALGPDEQLTSAAHQVQGLQARLAFAFEQRIERQTQKLASLTRMLHSVSPLPTIGRGFALVTDASGAVVSSVSQVKPGGETVTYLQDGAVVGEVKEVRPGVTLSERENT